MRYLFSILLYLSGLCLSLQIISANQSFATSNLPEDVTIPPPFELSYNLWLPSVNQFIITPLPGKISVYYIGIFNNKELLSEHTKQFILPFPKGANSQNTISVQLQSGVQQIQESFIVDAPFGNFDWKPNQLAYLPGVTVILLNDPKAKIIMQSENFIHDTSDKSLKGEQYVRVSWSQDTQYPQFKILNILPSRMFILIWIGSTALVLLLSIFIFFRIKKHSN